MFLIYLVWPQTHNPPPSASQGLRLQVCTTTLRASPALLLRATYQLCLGWLYPDLPSYTRIITECILKSPGLTTSVNKLSPYPILPLILQQAEATLPPGKYPRTQDQIRKSYVHLPEYCSYLFACSLPIPVAQGRYPLGQRLSVQ